MYVYILSDYGEDGAEHVAATLDRSKLVDLLAFNFPNEGFDEERYAAWLDRTRAGLLRWLEKPDEELAAYSGGYNCGKGWGGVQLHVVKLAYKDD